MLLIPRFSYRTSCSLSTKVSTSIFGSKTYLFLLRLDIWVVVECIGYHQKIMDLSSILLNDLQGHETIKFILLTLNFFLCNLLCILMDFHLTDVYPYLSVAKCSLIHFIRCICIMFRFLKILLCLCLCLRK